MITDADTNYFTEVNRRLSEADEHVRKEVMKHVDYLAQKAGTSSAKILSGVHFSAAYQVLSDCRHNVESVFREKTDGPVAISPDSVEKMIELAEKSLEGWCSREKSMAIVKIINDIKPEICVEIGVYGGRSLIPAAAALRANGKGAIYGIETWRPDVATEHATNEVNDEWWTKIDFHSIKSDFYRFVAEHDLASQVRLIEAPSASVSGLFDTIDYLHIDGGHSIYNAAEDVIHYSKKVRKGGAIIMDDANWPSTGPAIAILDSFCDRVQSFNDDKGVIACIIYRKR
ncbi:class I SAM-dependent methyltransferase [Rhizobium sp. T136]|uniref:class I SAM-dependent methyltransferase n=1 Tax=Rhizobium sp. T136 TaxID=555319 RepID=UPI001E465F8E|nr:class I SAM-dependent methyltransferase [Rhizobium sp. T136]UFS83218.1 class I SAM-dependent methyltransferase [Rhizobium sp. T136]